MPETIRTGSSKYRQAARLAGIGRVEFLLTCMHMGVPSVEWDENEIERISLDQ